MSNDFFGERWHKELCHLDTEALLFRVLSKGADCVQRQDLTLVLKAMAESHSSLDFLSESPEFQTHYINTCLYRTLFQAGKAGAQSLTLVNLADLGSSPILDGYECKCATLVFGLGSGRFSAVGHCQVSPIGRFGGRHQ